MHVLLKFLVQEHTKHTGAMPNMIADRGNDIFQMSFYFQDLLIIMRDSMKLIPMPLHKVASRMLTPDMAKLVINHDATRSVLLLPNRVEVMTSP